MTHWDSSRYSSAENELYELLSRVVEGDERALETLYRKLDRTIYAFALRRLSVPQAAEEVVVETMYEVWRHAKRFAGQSRVTTWVLGIARHKALDKLNYRQAESLGEEAEAVIDETPGAYEQLARVQNAEQIVKCLMRLPEEQRECIHLVFYEGMSLAEVATVQGCPENTVKTRLFHARRKLRQYLIAVLGLEWGGNETVFSKG